METGLSNESSSFNTSQPQARVSTLFKIGALVTWVTMIALVVLVAPLLREKHPKFGADIYACLAVFGVGLLAAIVGWASHQSGANSRRRNAKMASLPAIAGSDNASWQNTLSGLPLAPSLPLSLGMDFKATPENVVDVVLAEKALVLIHRYVIPADTRTGAMLCGGLIGAAIEGRRQKGEMKKLQKNAEKQRAEEQNMPLIQQVQLHPESIVIPVRDIQGIEKDKQGMVTVQYGFERIGLGMSVGYEGRIHGWLSEARTRNNLPAENPPPFSRKAIDEWARSPGAAVPKEVEAEFAALEGRPTLQQSLAACASLDLARAIGAMPRPSEAAVQVRRCALERIVDSNAKFAGIALLSFVLGTPIATIAIGVAVTEKKPELMAVVIGGLCAMIGLFGLIALPASLLQACRADAEGRK